MLCHPTLVSNVLFAGSLKGFYTLLPITKHYYITMPPPTTLHPPSPPPGTPRMQSSVLQLEREAAMREAALAAAGEEVASLHESNRAAQMAANQYLLDLQASSLVPRVLQWSVCERAERKVGDVVGTGLLNSGLGDCLMDQFFNCLTERLASWHSN